MKHNNTNKYYTPIQLKMSVDMERIIKNSDPVYVFSDVVDRIDLYKYFATEERKTGRRKYDRIKLFKIVLFAFMEHGYCSVRQIRKLCETDIRFLWILDESNPPSVMTIHHFIHNTLQNNIETIFSELNQVIFAKENVDVNHAYLDGTKLKANANNYSWVWKKSCIKNRNKVFEKISALLTPVNQILRLLTRSEFQVRQEYNLEYLDCILETFLKETGINWANFVHGSGWKYGVSQRKTILFPANSTCKGKSIWANRGILSVRKLRKLSTSRGLS